MNQEEIINIESELKKRFLKLEKRNGFSYHETVKSFLCEYFDKQNFISIPEYKIGYVYVGRKRTKTRYGSIDLVVKDNIGNIIYGIEIDRGIKRNSLSKLNELKPKEKVIVSLSSIIYRHLWKLPSDVILINIPINEYPTKHILKISGQTDMNNY
jgi:hypothetical protein